VGRGIGDHQGGEFIAMLLPSLEIIQVNVALRVTAIATTFMPHITALAGFVP